MAWAYFSGGAAANNAHISSNLTIATFMSAPVYRLGCRVGRLAAKCTLESGEMFHILLLAWRLGRGIWAPHKRQPGTRQAPLCYPSGADKLASFHCACVCAGALSRGKRRQPWQSLGLLGLRTTRSLATCNEQISTCSCHCHVRIFKKQ